MRIAEIRAYHGSEHHFGEFSIDHIGTGNGASTFGWGIYVSAERTIANRYKKRGGKLYVVDIPDVSEMLDWNAPFSQQSALVQAAILSLNYPEVRQRMMDEEEVSGYRGGFEGDSGEDIYGLLVSAEPPPDYSLGRSDQKAVSMMLLGPGSQASNTTT